MGMEVGTLAKSFNLPSSKGGSTKVPAKNASVVFFFQKSDTPGCSAEADKFDELAGDFAKKGVQVVGVSMEEVEALTASNEGRKTKLGFSARETFLISNKGEILDKWSEGKNMANVKSGAHAEQVLEAIDEKVDAGFSLASLFS